MRLTQLFLGCALSASITFPAFAAPASDPALEELFTAMNLERVIKDAEVQMVDQSQQMIPNLVDGQIGQVLSANPKFQQLSPEMRENLKVIATDFSARLSQAFEKEYPARISIAEATKNSARDLYKKYYSDEEVKELTKFYMTPIGKKSLEVTPKLVTEQMQVMSRTVYPEINKLMLDILNREGPKLVEEINKTSVAAK